MLRYKLRTQLLVLAIAPIVLWWAVTDPLNLVAFLYVTFVCSLILLVPVLMLAFLWKMKTGTWLGRRSDALEDSPDD